MFLSFIDLRLPYLEIESPKSMREKLSIGEYYHVYNRGTDKRDIFMCSEDLERFFLSMSEFNSLEPIGSIYEHGFQNRAKENRVSNDGLVRFIAYCLNPNHYHFILQPIVEQGIEKFMQRLGIGYTMYFNEKYTRSGTLFQGRYKAKHVSTNEHLLHLSAYVNLNAKVHGLGDSISKSSWCEYIGHISKPFCEKDIILSQFRSKEGYTNYCEHALDDIIARKQKEKSLRLLLIE